MSEKPHKPPGRQSKRRELTSSDCMVPADPLAALGAGEQPRFFRGITSGKPLTYREKVSMKPVTSPGELNVRASALALAGCVACSPSGTFCPRGANSALLSLRRLPLATYMDALQTSKKWGFFVLSTRRRVPEAHCARAGI